MNPNLRPNRRCPAFAAGLLAAAVAGTARLSAQSAAPASAGEAVDPRPPSPPVMARAGDLFEDVTRRAGIDFVHQFCHRRIANILLSNGAGAVVFDYDNDGWVDLYFLNWGPLAGVTAAAPGTPRQPNRLYRNRGDGTFEDVTRKAGLEGAGYASAAAAGDIDNDGRTDLFVACVGRHQLFRNRGDGTFEEIGRPAGVSGPSTGISAVFLDYDHDGWLDLYLGNYLTYVPENTSEQNPGAYPGPLAYRGEANVLFRNRGNGTFEDVTAAAGLSAPGQRAMSVSAFDANLDGHTDLYVSNDDTPNMLWLNNGKGRYQEVAMDVGVAFNSIGEAPGSMNAAIGDANGDGWPDLFVTRFGYGSLYVRRPNGFYDDRIYASGLGRITQPYVGWGGCFLDFDNDGDRDLAVANGDAFKLEGTRTLLLENSGEGSYTDASAKGGACFEAPVNGRGTAILDYDNDGRLDILITALADRPFLLRNRGSSANHWLKLQLEGTRGNRNGYGALIRLAAGEFKTQAEALCPSGFLAQGDARPHFGLGAHATVDRLEIRWPSGTTQVLTNLAADRILKVREPQL